MMLGVVIEDKKTRNAKKVNRVHLVDAYRRGADTKALSRRFHMRQDDVRRILREQADIRAS